MKRYNITLSEEVGDKLNWIKKELDLNNLDVTIANCVIIAERKLKGGV